MIRSIIIITALTSMLAHANGDEVFPGEEFNGCGTEGIVGLLVPDSTLLSRCKFEAACNKHDICYGKCKERGELYGKATCTDELAKEARRASCDTEFFNDIVDDNNEKYVCSKYAEIYRFFVVKFGKGNFDGREVEDFAEMAIKLDQPNIELLFKELKIKEKMFPKTKIDFDKERGKLILEQLRENSELLKEAIEINVKGIGQ